MSKITAFTIENSKVESNDKTIELAIKTSKTNFPVWINN